MWAEIADRLGIAYQASTAVTELYAYVVVQHPDGTVERLISTENAFTANRTLNFIVKGGQVLKPGEVVSAHLFSRSTLKRGQFYAQLYLDRSGHQIPLAAGYLYVGHDSLQLGEIVGSGPGGGEGFRSLVAVAENVAGNAAVQTLTLGVTNTIRRYYSLILLYNASADVATRVLQFILRGPGTLPTGMATRPVIYATGTVSLTASEEGAIYIGEDGAHFTGFNDNGTVTYANHTTAPHPFPYTAMEGDLAVLESSIASGHANDVWSLYVDTEEWLVI